MSKSSEKEVLLYGPHKYPGSPRATSDCDFGCGCWAGPTSSGGHMGLDPFGECPNNPKDGKRLSGTQDYERVVTGRIFRAETRAAEAERLLEAVSPGEKLLAEQKQAALRERIEFRQLVIQMVAQLPEDVILKSAELARKSSVALSKK